MVESTLSSRRVGPYTVRAAIASVHADAPTAATTNWAQIAGLYDVLMRVEPSPVVEPPSLKLANNSEATS